MPFFARRSVFWKYAAYFAGLVSALLIVSGAIGGYFAYRQAVAAQEQIQRTKAHLAAAEIENFMGSAQEPCNGRRQVQHTQPSRSGSAPRARRAAPAPPRNQRAALDRSRRQRAADVVAPDRYPTERTKLGHDPRFRGARAASEYIGHVYFLKETEPYVSVAAARDSVGSVVLAEVNLKYVWDVISQTRLTAEGAAFVVDRSGQLISHPDIGLVLGKTNLSVLPHVRRVLWDGPLGGELGGRPSAQREGCPGDLHRGANRESWLDRLRGAVARRGVPPRLRVDREVRGAGPARNRRCDSGQFGLARPRMVRPIREIEARARELGDGKF